MNLQRIIQDNNENSLSAVIRALKNVTCFTEDLGSAMRAFKFGFDAPRYIVPNLTHGDSEQDIPSQLWEEMILNGVQDGRS